MDTAGHALSWNEGVKRALGFDEEEFIGLNIATTIFTPEDVVGLESAPGQGTRFWIELPRA